MNAVILFARVDLNNGEMLECGSICLDRTSDSELETIVRLASLPYGHPHLQKLADMSLADAVTSVIMSMRSYECWNGASMTRRSCRSDIRQVTRLP